MLYASWQSVQAWTVGDLKHVSASGNANENQHFLDDLTSTRLDPSSKMQDFISPGSTPPTRVYFRSPAQRAAAGSCRAVSPHCESLQDQSFGRTTTGPRGSRSLFHVSPPTITQQPFPSQRPEATAKNDVTSWACASGRGPEVAPAPSGGGEESKRIFSESPGFGL